MGSLILMYLDFLNSYLEPRIGHVAVEGALSEATVLCDMVFQGTVLGPCLWNAFFHDIAMVASEDGGEEAAFADDFNVFKRFDFEDENEAIVGVMATTRESCHRWGKRNRVTFDATKEHFAVLHPTHGEGEVSNSWDV